MDDSSSLPVDLLLEVFVKGGAVTPDKTLYNSIAESLRDKGLALKNRNRSVFLLFCRSRFFACLVSSVA